MFRLCDLCFGLKRITNVRPTERQETVSNGILLLISPITMKLRIIEENDIDFDKKYVHIYGTNPSKDLSTNWSLTI